MTSCGNYLFKSLRVSQAAAAAAPTPPSPLLLLRRTFANKTKQSRPHPRIFQLSIADDDGTTTPATTGPVWHSVKGTPPNNEKSTHHPKFKNPRKRASKLFHELKQEAVQNGRLAKPAVFQTKFRVGDAVELEIVASEERLSSPTATNRLEKVRGVVLGHEKRGISESIRIRDVLHGEPVERKVQLFNPLVKSLKVLEKNFVYKGKRKVKRAKLYYLRNRPDNDSKVTKM